MAAGTSSQQKNLTEMTLVEYVDFRMLNEKLRTATDRDHQMESLAAMTVDVLSDDPEKQLDASYSFRKILEIGPNPPFKQVVAEGVVPRFFQFLDQPDFPQLQYEALYIFCLLAESYEDFDDLVIDNDIDLLAKLGKLVHAPSECTSELAIDTMAHMAWATPVFRIAFRNYAMEPLLTHLRKKHNSPDTLTRAAKALYSFCKGDPPLNSEMSTKVLPVIQDLLHSPDELIVAIACSTLECLSHGKISDVQADIQRGVCSDLLEMIHHTSHRVIWAAIKTVANILKGDNILAKHLVNPRTIRQLEKLLSGKYGAYNNDIRKAACQTVTCITKESCNHTQEVVRQGIIHVLVNLFTSSEADMKMEVAWAMSNVTSNGTSQDVKSVSEACIQPLCEMLDSPDQPPLVVNCIRGLDRILDVWQQEVTDGISDAFRYAQMIEDAEGLQKIVKIRDEGLQKIMKIRACGQGLASELAGSFLGKYARFFTRGERQIIS